VQLIRPIGTELAQTTNAGNPFDACPVTDLPHIVHGVSHSDDRTGTLVPGYALGRLHHGQSEAGPFIVEKRLVTGTQAAPVDLDEDLVGLGLRNIDLGHWGRGGIPGTLANGRILLGRDVDACHIGKFCFEQMRESRNKGRGWC
jgi:hypothetical protein